MSADLKSKLSGYEVTPPASAWDRITTSLDESPDYALAVRLQNLEVQPPAKAWQKIDQAIHEVAPARKQGRAIPLFRYAAAAAAILLVALSLYFIFPLNGNGDNIAVTPVDSSNTSASSGEKDKDTASSNNLPERGAGDATDNEILIASSDIPVRRMSGTTPASMYAFDDIPVELSSSFSVADLEEKYAFLNGENLSTPTTPEERYFMFISPDGYVIRMSKKLAGMLGCLYNNSADQDCNDRLKKWREKIAQSPVTPSHDNFLDIVDMVRSIQENKP